MEQCKTILAYIIVGLQGLIVGLQGLVSMGGWKVVSNWAHTRVKELREARQTHKDG